MEPRTIVITGASDGIGAAAARHLAARGDRVVVVGRSPDKTAAVARGIGADHVGADFTRLDDVHALATHLLAAYPTIDVLANNAGGIMGGGREETVDGHEKTFQVNHLAPFLLTTLLLDRLVASQARVINTSSIAARRFSKLRLDDLDARSSYSAFTAYGNAKLANVLHSKELVRRYGHLGLTSASFHPGDVATNFSSESDTIVRLAYRTPLKHLLLISPDKGADTLEWLATSTPGRDWTPREYYVKRRPARTHPDAASADLARDLWDRSADMLSLAV
jgi:NAD(P)-dependent dehydrogenase (short-subunit alcohol dehydrogenase family)